VKRLPEENPMNISRADAEAGEPISFGAALMAGKKVPPDVTALLMEDHRTVIGWFEWYRTETVQTQKTAVLASILQALSAHMAAEEEIFYPEAARCTGDRDLVEHARREHEQAKKIMAKLQREIARPTDSLVFQLQSEVETHVREEETALFPKVRASDMDLYRVGALIAARRVEVLFEWRKARRR
jgi:hemerythrin-like domain-containing protein